jgi:cell division protein FtsA
MNDKIVVGLDIGTTKICAIVGRLDNYGKLEVLGMGKAFSEGVKEGIVTNIHKTTVSIEQAIEEAEKNSGIDIKVVNVGIAGKHIKSSLHHGSITRKSDEDEITVDDLDRLTNDMYRIVTEPGSEIIHVMPQLYTVDNEENIKDPVGMSGIRLGADFHIITAHTNAIRNIKKCVERSGLEIENLILEPLASSMAVLTEEEKEAGVALVDIGGGTTDIAVFHDSIIRHSAVIPFGGNIITSDIKQGCSVMQNQAELLKVKFGRCLSAEASENEVVSIPGLRNRPSKEISLRNLSCIVEARMEEIIEMVYAEIMRSGYRNRLAGGIVITGGGAQLQDLTSLFELKTGMDARIGYPNEHLGKSKDDSVKSPMYATTIGLVLAGFRTIDERDMAYMNQIEVGGKKTVVKQASGSGVAVKTDFFGNIIRRTKELLLDDVGTPNNY